MIGNPYLMDSQKSDTYEKLRKIEALKSRISTMPFVPNKYSNLLSI